MLITKTKYVDVEVDVEVDVDLDEFDDEDIVQRCIDLGYQVYEEGEDTMDEKRLSKLFTDYLTLSPDKFTVELEKFFREYGFYK